VWTGLILFRIGIKGEKCEIVVLENEHYEKNMYLPL
jgi:hypothetical protein